MKGIRVFAAVLFGILLTFAMAWAQAVPTATAPVFHREKKVKAAKRAKVPKSGAIPAGKR